MVYVNREPLQTGDVGIFCVDGGMFCKQYDQDDGGIVHLYSLNRSRADADVVLTPLQQPDPGVFWPGHHGPSAPPP